MSTSHASHARLVLVRHGRSHLAAPPGLITHDDIQRWRVAYDAAGIRPLPIPSPALLQVAAEARHIVSSDLRRAVESAERLAPNRPILVTQLVRETHLVVPDVPARLPFAVWEGFIHARWRYQILRDTDLSEEDKARAAAATTLLSDLVSDGSTAVVVMHGVFRRVLGRHLLRHGWTTASRHGWNRNWSSWTLASDLNARTS